MNLYYARLLVHRPCSVIVVIFVIATFCSVYPFITKKIPDFSDPTAGFETRGTIIGDRSVSWVNLIKDTRPSGSLAVNPKDIIDEIEHFRKHNRSDKFRNGKKQRPKNKDTRAKVAKIKQTTELKNANRIVYAENSSLADQIDDDHEHWGYGKNLTYPSREDESDKIEHIRNQWKTLKNSEYPPSSSEHHHISSDGFFCGGPMSDYAHLVLKSTDGSSLLKLDNLHSICTLQQRLIDAGGSIYPELCQQSRPPAADCCPPWSLPNYIALLSNRTSCMDISQEDIAQTFSLLTRCVSYFHTLKLASDCETEKCKALSVCYKYNAVYNILSYIVDTDFLPPNNNSKDHVHTSMVYLPLAKSTSILEYYYRVENADLTHDNVSIVAMDLGVKNTVFDKWLIQDTWLLGLGGIFVVCCMWLYTGSFFVTLSTCVAIIYAMGISYFIYTVVFSMPFFPFMNLLTGVVAVGIGSDDMFIFIKKWESRKEFSSDGLTSLEVDPGKLEELMKGALRDAAVPMLVTSLTTAATFYASYISNITAINCFSIFTGTVVMVNYLMMMTWLPASVVLYEKWFNSPENKSWNTRLKPMREAIEETWSMMSRFLVVSVLKLRWFWLLLLGSIAVLSAYIVLCNPGLKLPDTRSFQLLQSSQLFEQYDLNYRGNYWFERSSREWANGNKMPLRWVWGVIPVDNGNHMDPLSHGSLIMDPTFNVSDPQAQIWLWEFCLRLKGQPFYQSTLGLLLPNCFIENFVSWMSRKCIDVIDGIDRAPCCEMSEFPFSSSVFDTCIVRAITALYRTPREWVMPGVAGPKFSKRVGNRSLPRIAALVVEFESSHTFSESYEAMEAFYAQVENWTRNQLSNAPPGMRNGWFVSDLDFYDLQRTLSDGTLNTIVVSMGIAFAVLLLVTLNIVISLFAIATITFSISVTVAILILLGWRLNILESIAVMTAVGLAVDFSLHVGLAYKGAEGDRRTRAAAALAAAAPPTAMAALTTGLAGALMLPARVLPYTQIGAFLVVVMAVSWCYATFFLGALLSVAGPAKRFGQFSYPTMRAPVQLSSAEGSASTWRSVKVPSNPAAGPLECGAVLRSASEGHELQHLAGGAGRSKSAALHDQSPSVSSAMTIVLAEEGNCQDYQAQ